MCSLLLENDFHRRYAVRNNVRGILRTGPLFSSFIFYPPPFDASRSVSALPTVCFTWNASASCVQWLKTSLLIDSVATPRQTLLPSWAWKVSVTRSNGISRLIENYPCVLPSFALRRNITIYIDNIPLSGDDESFSWGLTKCASIEKTFLLAARKESVGKELKRWNVRWLASFAAFVSRLSYRGFSASLVENSRRLIIENSKIENKFDSYFI